MNELLSPGQPVRTFGEQNQLLRGMNKTGDVRSPANTFVFTDVEPASICFSPFFIPERDNATWFHSPGALHAKGAVLSFADGHTEAHRWRAPNMRTMKNNERPHPAPRHTNDVAWLRRKAHHDVAP